MCRERFALTVTFLRYLEMGLLGEDFDPASMSVMQYLGAYRQ